MKKSQKQTIDALIWGGLAVLPLLAYLIYLIHGGNAASITEFYTANVNFRCAFIADVYIEIIEFFDANPTSAVVIMCDYLSYITVLEIIHIAVDVLLLLPRMCQRLQDKIGGDKK